MTPRVQWSIWTAWVSSAQGMVILAVDFMVVVSLAMYVYSSQTKQNCYDENNEVVMLDPLDAARQHELN